jgi:hypothetical protein
MAKIMTLKDALAYKGAKSADFDLLVAGLKDKSISIQTVADNTGASFGYVAKMINPPISGQVWNDGEVNANGVLTILLYKEINPSDFSMADWTIPEKTAKVVLDFAIGDFVKLTKSSGKQSPECQYRVEWQNANYILFVPFSGFGLDVDGTEIKTPRCYFKDGVTALEPVKV